MIATLLASFLALGGNDSCCGMEAFANDPKFLAFHLSPVDPHFTASAGSNVTYKDKNGKETAGFYVPPAKGRKQAIIVVHEWWGLNDNIRKEAERINSVTGDAVLAVDLYEGQVAKEAKEAGKLMQGVDKARAKAIVNGAVKTLKSGGFSGFKASKIGSVGFCFGGGWSFQTAIEGGKDLNACVIFYGMPDTSPSALAAVKAPVMFHHPMKDGWITEQVVGDFASKMGAIKKPVQVFHYDADHAFANPSNPRYDEKSSKLAWDRTFAFFKKQLG